jgi:hypothetical protein
MSAPGRRQRVRVRQARVALFDAEGWRTTLDDALRQTAGRLTKEERAWADSLLLDPAVRKPHRRYHLVILPDSRLSRQIRQAAREPVALDGPDATAVGLLLARTATADIADAPAEAAVWIVLRMTGPRKG